MHPDEIITMEDATDELAAIAAKIEANARTSDELLVEAAQLLAATKARFVTGEIVGQTWLEWAMEALSLGERRIYELLRIGEAPDPLFELKFQRELNAGRQAQFRARRAAPPANSLYVQRLIEWAQAAPEDDVERVVTYISTLPSARAGQRQAPPAPPKIYHDEPPALRNAGRPRPSPREWSKGQKKTTAALWSVKVDRAPPG